MASLALVLLSPLILVAAVAVRRSSSGPILYRQRRVGLDGQEFELLKFRSMVVGAERRRHKLAGQNVTDGLFKMVEDPRVTPAGRGLRRTSLDELPQLLNVLQGTMARSDRGRSCPRRTPWSRAGAAGGWCFGRA